MSVTDQASTFFSSGEDVITKVIDVKPIHPVTHDLDAFYEIGRTAEEIIEGNYKRIALQFPDELLHDSVPIYRRLKSKLGEARELYVLADTSYGSCCVDEVAASHVDAEAMVHYGHACMSQTSRLPVIYVFGKNSVDVESCTLQLISAFDDKKCLPEGRTILLKHEVAYTHQADRIFELLEEKLRPREISVVYHKVPLKIEPVSAVPKTSSTVTPCLKPQTENATIFYVGGESLALTNFLITNSSSNVFSFNPETGIARYESGSVNRLLQRRYAIVQKARDADVFGILVGTLGVANYLPLIKHLRNLVLKKRKKSYTISVGKLNPAKLANFLEIECFVLVACPENSMIESKEFLRPIVTPYELDIALQEEQTWTGRYLLDFEHILANDSDATSLLPVAANGEEGASDEDQDKPVFSLVTGTYRHPKRYGMSKENRSEPGTPLDAGGTSDSAVVLRNQGGAVAKFSMESAAGQFLQQRTYRGLDPKSGGAAPSVLEQGRSGVARGYQDDLEHQTY